jgi:hypothetical protein
VQGLCGLHRVCAAASVAAVAVAVVAVG